MKHLLNLLRERRTADDDLVETTAQSLTEALAHLLSDAVAKHRNFQKKSHFRVFHLRQNGLAHNLLNNEWNGHNQAGLDLLEGRHKYLWSRGFRQEIDVHALTEFEDEFKGHTVHVGHRQHGENLISGMKIIAQCLYGKLAVAPDGAIRNHNALGVGRRAGGVVDHRQLFGLVIIIMYILGRKAFGEFMTEEFVEMLAGMTQFLAARKQYAEVLQIDHTQECVHLLRIECSVDLLVDEENTRF